MAASSVCAVGGKRKLDLTGEEEENNDVEMLRSHMAMSRADAIRWVRCQYVYANEEQRDVDWAKLMRVYAPHSRRISAETVPWLSWRYMPKET